MLRGSEKDRAENLMIVDLVRNDLGKVCAVGSVRVGALFAIETLPTVHHLVSEVRGRMDSGGDFFSLLRACFPGGSVTGAPKLRAMQVIAELEPHRRSVYCGSILSISGQHLLANIPIRTMLYRGGSLFYWSGGGIVADSRGDDEYAESEHKALAFRRLLESLRAAPDQGVSSAGRRG